MAIKKTKNGFTLIEVLFTLSISLLIVFSIVNILSLSRGKKIMKVIEANMEIGMKALSQDIYLASNFQYGDTLLYEDNEGEINTIYLHDKRIVREPGFVIYMHDIDSVFFHKIGHGIYVTVSKEKVKKTFLIGMDITYEENK